MSRPRLRLIATALVLTLVAVAGQASFSASDPALTYVVRPGDSLWAISEHYDISVSQLAAANGMQPTDLLLIGRRLVIPQAPPPPPVTYTPATFCAKFQPQPGPRGLLPQPLPELPDRLALRRYFQEWAVAYGVSPALEEAIGWQESGWQENVVSSAGAVGIGQLLPVTATFVSTDLVGEPLNIDSVNDNIRMSAAYLAYLSQQEGGNLCRTIAAYYEGPRNLAAYGVFVESQAYVASVEALIPRFS